MNTCMSRTTTYYQQWKGDDAYKWMYRVANAQWSQSVGCDTIADAAFEVLANWEGNPSASPPEYLMWADMRNKREEGFHSVFYDANNPTVVVEHALVISRDSIRFTEVDRWETFLHEAAHHAGWSDSDAENRATQCAPLPPDPPDDDGGGAVTSTVTWENWECLWEKQIHCSTGSDGSISCESVWVFLGCQRTL